MPKKDKRDNAKNRMSDILVLLTMDVNFAFWPLEQLLLTEMSI